MLGSSSTLFSAILMQSVCDQRWCCPGMRFPQKNRVGRGRGRFPDPSVCRHRYCKETAGKAKARARRVLTDEKTIGTLWSHAHVSMSVITIPKTRAESRTCIFFGAPTVKSPLIASATVAFKFGRAILIISSLSSTPLGFARPGYNPTGACPNLIVGLT